MMLQGKVFWARVLGKPHKTKFSPGQWSFDFSLTAEIAQQLLEDGMKKSYIKNEGDERGSYLSFVRNATKTDGTAGKPFKIVDNQGNAWPEDTLIGNESVINAIIILSERTFRGEKFLKPSCLSVQVWDLVPYHGSAGGSGSTFPVKKSDNLESDLANEKDHGW